MVSLYPLPSPAASRLDQLRSLSGNRIELSGDFGADCAQCEILVDYGAGLLYAYTPERWHSDKLSFKIEDLGRSLRLRVMVKTSSGTTTAKPVTIKPRFEPQQLQGSPATSGKGPSALVRRHSDPFGGKGSDRFDVSTRTASCGQTGKIFQDARLSITKSRFGDARIQRKPGAGCTSCTPLEVEWYHEPTGSIEYQLQLQHRIISGICNKRIRR